MRKGLVFILFLCSSILGMAQSGVIRGFVYDNKTGEPVIFTNVVLKGTSLGSTTDQNGFYSITKIPAGDYTIQVSYLGYQTLEEAISVEDDDILTQKIYLKEQNVQLETFEVSAEKEEARTEVKMSMTKLTPKQITKMPSVGGQPDLAQYLQVLPGVVFTGDQGGQLYIRGGSPIQNKVLLDGMIVYNPFHSIGLFSVFDTDILRNADVYTGGFNAEYGGRISSIMDITTKDGNKRYHTGKISANPFGSKLSVEGPLKRAKERGDGTVSYLFSGKTSYLEQTSKSLYSYVDSAGLPFNFNDFYGKVSFNTESGSKFNVFGLNFNDRVNFSENSSLNWVNSGFGSNFVLVPATSPVLVSGDFSYSTYDILFEEQGAGERRSSIDGFNFGLDFSYFLGQNTVKWGFEFLGFSTDFRFFNPLGREISQTENTTEFGIYGKTKLTSGKWIFDPSFRLHYDATLSTFSPEPRLGVKFNATSNLRFKFAGGLYSQNLIAANSDRDIVNLFYGFLSGPEDLQSEFTQKDGSTRDVTHKLQKSAHAILGAEYDLNRRMNINVEGYYKGFGQLTNVNRDKIFKDNADNSEKPDSLKKDFIIESGDAYGIDFVFKYEYKRLYLWAVYSHSYVRRWDGIREYFPVFDRRHNINLLGTYGFGKDANWELSARWNLGSGLPFTPTQGFYQKFTFEDGIYSDYSTANTNQVGILYGEINSKRLPYYHRLDINIKRTVVLGEVSELELNAGVTNAYNRANIFYFDRVSFERVNQLPILPSFGLSLRF
ncbi:MAG TPA: TonB-dependent receptor [Flavobacteriales bacterium]|nr:TonB-dependent receptor [Flavobacteriales bacterium]